MIPLAKLAKLSPRHRMRKAALVLGEIERQLLSSPETAASFLPYCKALAALIADSEGADQSVRTAALALGRHSDVAGSGTVLARAVDSLRHTLYAVTGQAPADWDLLDPATGRPDSRGARKLNPGKKVFLEDLRSPFNVGSIFRTADAFGVEELLLSPACADPLHPRALRSAMGAVELTPWKRADLDSLVDVPIFALELGGVPINDFSFPDKGIVVLGSEELGISREAREKCSHGIVSIPMSGSKGSLNVAVAFGILMYAWTVHLV